MSNYEKLQLDYAELKQQVEESKIENVELNKQLNEQKRTVSEGWQPFYGLWLSVNYYKADGKGAQECWKEMKIHRNYISLSSDNND